MCSDGTGPPQEPCEHQAGHNGEAGAGPGQRGEAPRAAIADTKTGTVREAEAREGVGTLAAAGLGSLV